MPENALAQLLVITGFAAVLAMLTRIALARWALPAQVGYLLLGLGLRIANEHWRLMDEGARSALDFLGELGIVALLFHVGLRSNPRALAQQLPKAAAVWVCDVVLASGAGFAAARYLLELELLPSMFVGAALSATSVGVSLLSWDHAGALRTRAGEFLLDLAELDDLSAVLLLVVLVAVAPAFSGGEADVIGTVAREAGLALFFLALLALLAYLFARYLEQRVTIWFRRHDGESAMLVVVLGFGLVIAGLAGVAGFSAAVGALLAGLAFSRDPDAVRMDARFATIYDLFTPFFFLVVGYAIEPSALGSALGIGLLLVVAGIVGKVLGAGVPSYWLFGSGGAVAIGASMVPRAEIAMVVARRAQEEAIISQQVYAGLVTVSAVTCLLSPLVVRAVLARWQPDKGPDGESGGEAAT